jgi:outer membrane lipoprotein SlyB
MKQYSLKSAASFISALLIALSFEVSQASAANPEPKLYPNKHLAEVGESKAKQDIAACSSKAAAYVQQSKQQGDGLKAGVRGAARGALLGTAGGAIAGNTGRGAATGAVVGTTASAMKGVRERGSRDPAYQQYVNSCLEDKGYRVVEWR